jgi:hypothetical protein
LRISLIECTGLFVGRAAAIVCATAVRDDATIRIIRGFIIMRPTCKLLALFALVVLAGCAARSKHHAPTAEGNASTHATDSTVDAAAVVRSIRLCRTQLAELQQLLGEPTRDGMVHKQHIISWIVQWDAPTRYLAVMLNAQNTVVDLYWNVPSEIPWSPTDQCLAP